jgi:hypothetical protein
LKKVKICRTIYNSRHFSNRASNILPCLKELIQLAATNQTDLGISRTIGSILQLYMIRAPPVQHCGADAGKFFQASTNHFPILAVYFNDCLYLAIELERTKFELIYKLVTFSVRILISVFSRRQRTPSILPICCPNCA